MCKEAIVFIGTQLVSCSLIYRGTFDHLVTVNRHTVCQTHQWLASSSSRKSHPFTFNLDPKAQLDRSHWCSLGLLSSSHLLLLLLFTVYRRTPSSRHRGQLETIRHLSGWETPHQRGTLGQDDQGVAQPETAECDPPAPRHCHLYIS